MMAFEREGFLTLGVDTATEKRSVAVFRGARQCSVCVSDSSDGGSANVLGDIERALEESSAGLEEFELFAAASGPGSFTGSFIISRRKFQFWARCCAWPFPRWPDC